MSLKFFLYALTQFDLQLVLNLSERSGISPFLEWVSCAFLMSVVKRQKREGCSDLGQSLKFDVSSNI